MRLMRQDQPGLFGNDTLQYSVNHQLRLIRPDERTGNMRPRLSASVRRALWTAAAVSVVLFMLGIFSRHALGEVAANLLFFLGAMGVTLVTLVAHSVNTAAER
jgi:hypothetical protein